MSNLHTYWRSKIAVFSLPLAICAANGAEFVITEEDFEGVEISWGTTGGVSTLNVVADPEVGGTRGMVAEVGLTGGGEWGGVETLPPLSLGIVSYGK